MFIKHASQDHDKRNFQDEDNEDIIPKNKNEKTIFEDASSDPLKKLQKLAGQSQNVYLTIRSIYPLDLFPDTITIDANKINIITKELFGAENVHSILIEDITNLTVATGLFSATLEIVDSSNLRFPITYTIKHLKIHEATLARRLIQGLIAAKREDIDLSVCEGKDVLACLNILGRAKGEHQNNKH